MSKKSPIKSSNTQIDALKDWISRVTSREWQFAGIGAVLTLILVLLLSIYGGVDFSLGRSANSNSDSSFTASGSTAVSAEQSGNVVLTEAQLRAEVKKISVPVYWAGPQEGARYTLENQANLRIFVRYLPDGKIPPEGEPSRRIIGTYILKDAFESTRLAGTSVAGGTGLLNEDGGAVYYSSSLPNNVYVAYRGVDAQIEIFDPANGVSLELATERGKIQVIK